MWQTLPVSAIQSIDEECDCGRETMEIKSAPKISN